MLPNSLQEEIKIATHWVENQCGCCPYDHLLFVAEKEWEYAKADAQYYRTWQQQHDFVEEVIWKEAQSFVDMVRGA